MKPSARQSCLLLAALAAALCRGCGPLPGAQRVPLDSPDYQRAADQLALWPARPREETTRHVAVTLHSRTWDATCTGTVTGYGPRDFRIVLTTADGKPVLDASRNWAGVRVFEHALQLTPGLVQAVVYDLSRALDPPPIPVGLVALHDRMALERTGPDGPESWLFDRPTGRLISADVGTLRGGALHVEYRAYDDGGRVTELFLRRADGRYELLVTFADGPPRG